MTRAIKFTKMHGAGNDYIYVDTTQYPISHPEELARAWSAPHTGIGSDGLVDRKSTRLNSSHDRQSRMPSSA